MNNELLEKALDAIVIGTKRASAALVVLLCVGGAWTCQHRREGVQHLRDYAVMPERARIESVIRYCVQTDLEKVRRSLDGRFWICKWRSDKVTPPQSFMDAAVRVYATSEAMRAAIEAAPAVWGDT